MFLIIVMNGYYYDWSSTYYHLSYHYNYSSCLLLLLITVILLFVMFTRLLLNNVLIILICVLPCLLLRAELDGRNEGAAKSAPSRDSRGSYTGAESTGPAAACRPADCKALTPMSPCRLTGHSLVSGPEL